MVNKSQRHTPGNEARGEEVVVSTGKKVSIPRDEIYGVNFLRRNLIFHNLLGNVGGQNLERKKLTIIV